jgi:hypothetical protein
MLMIILREVTVLEGDDMSDKWLSIRVNTNEEQEECIEERVIYLNPKSKMNLPDMMLIGNLNFHLTIRVCIYVIYIHICMYILGTYLCIHIFYILYQGMLCMQTYNLILKNKLKGYSIYVLLISKEYSKWACIQMRMRWYEVILLSPWNSW